MGYGIWDILTITMYTHCTVGRNCRQIDTVYQWVPDKPPLRQAMQPAEGTIVGQQRKRTSTHRVSGAFPAHQVARR